MSDETSVSEPLADARRYRVATARLSTPDWVFSAVIHLFLVMVLVTSKAGPGGGGWGGSGGSAGEGTGGDGPGAASIELLMAADGGSWPPARLNSKTFELAAPLKEPETELNAAVDERVVESDTTDTQQVGFEPPEEPAPVVPAVVPQVTAAQRSTAGPGTSGRASAANGRGYGTGGSGDGSAGDGGDGQGGTSLFGIWDSGQRIVYVIDRSGSMQDFGKLDAARSELKSSLARLDASIEFQVLLYNQQVQPLNVRGSQGLARATVVNRNQILSQTQVVLPDGGTQHRAALQAALRLRPTVVYFLTDAEANGLTPDEISTIARQLAGATRIHCIQFGETPGEVPRAGNWLQQLAEAFGGKYVHVRTEALQSADGESRTRVRLESW